MTSDEFRESLHPRTEPPGLGLTSPSPDCGGMLRAIGREHTSLPSRRKAGTDRGCRRLHEKRLRRSRSSKPAYACTSTKYPMPALRV